MSIRIFCGFLPRFIELQKDIKILYCKAGLNNLQPESQKVFFFAIKLQYEGFYRVFIYFYAMLKIIQNKCCKRGKRDEEVDVLCKHFLFVLQFVF